MKLQELKLHKIYPKYYSLLIAQDLCPANYQILSIIFLKEFVELTLNLDAMIKNVTHRIKYKFCDCFLEYTNFKDDLVECKCFCCNSYQQKFDEKLKERFFNIHTSFLTGTAISLFYYCKKVFIFINIWMIAKNSIKHYLEK